jgi:beta-glucosidase
LYYIFIVIVRWYDANGVTPVFPFGHGLSYTTFTYSQLTFEVVNKTLFMDNSAPINSIVGYVGFTIANTGSRSGSEIPQIYLSYPESAQEPPKQMRNFVKVSVEVSQTQRLRLPLRKRDLSIWNSDIHQWQLISGEFQYYVAASARDIKLRGAFQV